MKKVPLLFIAIFAISISAQCGVDLMGSISLGRNVFLISIGIDKNYHVPKCFDLEGCANDAEAIYEAYCNIASPKTDLDLYINGTFKGWILTNDNAAWDTVRSIFEYLSVNAKAEDLLIITYSGLLYTKLPDSISGQVQYGFLLHQDPEHLGELFVLDLKLLNLLLIKIPCKDNILLLDGNLPDEKSMNFIFDFVNLKTKSQEKNFVLFFSSFAYELRPDFLEISRGLISYHFEKNLNKYSDLNHDGFITVNELNISLQKSVVDYNAKSLNKSTPKFYLFGNDFPIAEHRDTVFYKNKSVFLKIEEQAKPVKPRMKNYAVFFAVKDYQNWPSLDNPINDSYKIGKVLEDEYGFIVDYKLNPTMDTIESTIQDYYEKRFGDSSQLIIYFTGHGYCKNHLGYFVPQDAKPAANRIAEVSFYSYLVLREKVNSIPCKHIFLIIDACFSGFFDEKIARSICDEPKEKEKGTPKEKFIDSYTHLSPDERFSDYSQIKVRRFLSSNEGSTVKDGYPEIGSAFANNLTDALKILGKQDKYVTATDINSTLIKLQNKTLLENFGNDYTPNRDFVLFRK